MMTKWTKAHRATANRVAKRYGGQINLLESPDVAAPEMTIEVETHATLARAVRRLKTRTDVVYIAVTNKEALAEAIRLTSPTTIGVMDPQGNVVKAAGSSGSSDPNTPKSKS